MPAATAGVAAAEPSAPTAATVAPASIVFFMKSRLFTLFSLDILLPPFLTALQKGMIMRRTSK
jgi:hypothetical protein